MMTTHRHSDRFIVRLPDGMRDRIKATAEANNRSMNAEIVATLERSYPESRGISAHKLIDMMSEITRTPPGEAQEALLAQADEAVRRSGLGVRLQLSEERDAKGRREAVLVPLWAPREIE